MMQKQLNIIDEVGEKLISVFEPSEYSTGAIVLHIPGHFCNLSDKELSEFLDAISMLRRQPDQSNITFKTTVPTVRSNPHGEPKS